MDAYQEVLTRLFARRPSKRGDLSVMLRLSEALSHPHLNYPTIHVAGTNGKGQVSLQIARALQEGGYKVGLFISPHLLRYEERITINGQEIPKEKIIELDKQLSSMSASLGLTPHFFESTFCFALSYFAEQKVDVAVIEVGLGGKIDSTNILYPLVSIITSIGFDHTELLGDTLEKIAEEKAGIIKPATPVVLGPSAQLETIYKRAKKLKAPVHPVKETSSFYQIENQFVVKKALSCIAERFPLTVEEINKGLSHNLSCRFERRGNIIYDVAHNPDGFFRLAEALKTLYPDKKTRFVVGMNRYKDIKASLSHLVPLAYHIYFVKGTSPDSAQPQELGEIYRSLCSFSYSLEKSIKEGLEKAKGASEEKDLIVVCGSFYIMKEALTLAEQRG